MTRKVDCTELGIEGCEFTASGETARDVVQEMVEHLQTKHDVDMPDAEVIMEGWAKKEPLEIIDQSAALVVERLRKALHIASSERLDTPEKPVIGKIARIGG
jgi:predicted small metal-binding protein